jgi:DNA processing protein
VSQQNDTKPGACVQCRRRSWLLAALSASLDFSAADRPRLNSLLALDDTALIDALAGRRRAELQAGYEAFDAGEPSGMAGEAICRHCPTFPRMLLDNPRLPWLLHVSGSEGLERLATDDPRVAIVGSRRASDYGVEMARSLARGVTASGVGVVSALGDGVAGASLAGAVEADGAPGAVMGSGLSVSPSTGLRTLYRRLLRSGCAVSELPADCPGRRWGAVAGERIVAGLADVVVVIEAEDKAADLAVAQLAQSLGRCVAAMPGRVTSPLSRGTHMLLLDGAQLVRGAEDVLELLYARGEAPLSTPARAAVADTSAAALEPRLAAVLERVGAGRDTPDSLTGEGADSGEVLCALSELELLGLLARGDGGRYVPREPWV